MRHRRLTLLLRCCRAGSDPCTRSANVRLVHPQIKETRHGCHANQRATFADRQPRQNMTKELKPRIVLGALYNERNGHEDKLGGLPFGLPLAKWPKCAVCDRPMNFLAQFRNSIITNLGQSGRTLYLFQCPDGALCGAWDHRSGANAAILLDESEHTGKSTKSPDGAEVEPEGIIAGWTSVEPSEVRSYVGPLPSYSDNHDNDSEPQGRFLLQLVGAMSLEGLAPTPEFTGAQHLYYSGGAYGQDQVRIEDPPFERTHYGVWSRGQREFPGRPSQVVVRENGEWLVEWANFGDGTAYVFINDDAQEAHFFTEV